MKYLTIVFFLISQLLAQNVFAAGSDGGNTKSKYDQAVSLIKAAKNYEKKGKTKKAEKRYSKAMKLLILSNQKKPNKPDTLNYLGFAHRKIGDYENAEIYYSIGLALDPKHVGINEYMGELFVVTNRLDKAKERLAALKDCNCKEYDELKLVIEGKKESKY